MPNFLSPKATTAVCQGYDSATGSLLGSKCLKNYCKIKAIDLIKQLILVQKEYNKLIFLEIFYINNNQSTILFIIKEAKDFVKDFDLLKVCKDFVNGSSANIKLSKN